VAVPTRRREEAKHLIMLPTVDVVEQDIHDPRTLDRLFADRAAVINLVGIINESGRETFDRAHVELTRKVIAACHNAGVPRLLHMSALGASADAPSRYLKTKAAAEAMVAASGLKWTIFRPSVIFGREDNFLNMFAKPRARAAGGRARIAQGPLPAGLRERRRALLSCARSTTRSRSARATICAVPRSIRCRSS
jgi:NADH dehydrogenase